MLYSPDYHVEANVPMPEPIHRHEVYPWDRMQVGASFFVPCKPVRMVETRKRLYMATRYRGRKHNEKYAVRQVKGGVRVWRVK